MERKPSIAKLVKIKIMAKMISLDKKPMVNISIIGDEGSGKTKLRYAIAKYFWPKSKEPYSTKPVPPSLRECGSSDPSKRFEYETERRHYSQLNFLGDPFSYLQGLALGTAQIDGVILLVTASEGVMPQTKLCVMLARQMSVPGLVVFINKTDLIEDAGDLGLIEIEIRALLDQYGFDRERTPIVKGSALQAINGEAEEMEAIVTLMEAADQYIPTPVRTAEKPFLMPIEDVFSITDRGTVITGKLEKGCINTGDPVEIIGMRKEGEKPLISVIKGVDMFRKTLDRAEAGDNAGLILQGIDKDTIHRGMVICDPGSVNQAKAFSAEVFLSEIHQGAHTTSDFNGYKLYFRLRTASVTGQITLAKEIDVVLPGGKFHMEVTLDKAIAMEIGLPFCITTEKGPSIGAGRIIQILE